MKVKELMTKDVRACQPSTSLNDAARMMWENDCGALPVIPDDGKEGIVGMITDRDICMSAYHKGKNLKQLSVSDAMSKDVFSCKPDDDVVTAEKTMRESRVRRLPVVDGKGRLTGLLSLARIARTAVEGKGDLSEKEVGETLASICEPTSGSRVAPASVSR